MSLRALKSFILVAASAVASVIFANHAHAGTITVTLGFDRFDASATTGCTLREAIQTANTTRSGRCMSSGRHTGR
jgi:CSLREA domain-containing protein